MDVPSPGIPGASVTLEEPRPHAPGLEQTRATVLHFGGEPGKGPKDAASDF